MKTLKMVVHGFKTFWKRAWWSKIIIVIICLALVLYFWPFLLGGTLIFLIIQKIKSVKLRWSLVVPVVAVTLFFGSIWFYALVSPSKVKTNFVAVSTSTEKPNQSSQKPQVTASPTSALTTLPSPTIIYTSTPSSKPKSSPKTLSTMDKLWQAADKIFHDRKGMDINYNPNSKTVILTYGDKDSMFLNESGIVEGLFATFVEYGKQVFQIEEVDKLEVSVRTIFTDAYGKENLENAVIMDMDKEEFQKYSWDNLRFQPIYYQMNKSASELYIHPAILKKIDLSKIKLKY